MIAALILAASAAWSSVQFPSKDAGIAISGHVYLPTSAAPYPAVVLMHTCGGIDDALEDWATWLAQNGYAALVVDSFGPRHRESVCGTRDIPPRERALDAAGALTYLQSRDDIVATRIGIIGFSHGGGSVLWSERDVPGFKAGIAFYPSECDAKPASSFAFPLLVLIGAYDDWTDAAQCQAFVRGVDPTEQLGLVHVYPKVYHKFDDPSANRVAHVGHHDYTLRYDAAAAADAHARVLAFLSIHMVGVAKGSNP